MSDLLSNDGTKSVGLIVSERIMNIPPQLSVPLYETLFNEIRKARAKNIPNFDFTHYALLCRILTPPGMEEGTPEATAATIYQECGDSIKLSNANKSLRDTVIHLITVTLGDKIIHPICY